MQWSAPTDVTPLERYLTLHKGRELQRGGAGARWFAACILHVDHGHSLALWQSGTRWRCTGGCYRQGDLLDLIMRGEGLPDREAALDWARTHSVLTGEETVAVDKGPEPWPGSWERP